MSFPSKYAGTCTECGRSFPAGAPIEYDRATKSARHASCAAQERIPEREPGDESEAAPKPARKPRRARSMGEIAGPRVREEETADVVTCAHCGGSAAGRTMVHLACARTGEHVPF